jgi:hypothetical protein
VKEAGIDIILLIMEVIRGQAPGGRVMLGGTTRDGVILRPLMEILEGVLVCLVHWE